MKCCQVFRITIETREGPTPLPDVTHQAVHRAVSDLVVDDMKSVESVKVELIRDPDAAAARPARRRVADEDEGLVFEILEQVETLASRLDDLQMRLLGD